MCRRGLGLACTLVEQNKNVLLVRSDRSGNLCVRVCVCACIGLEL